MFESAACKWQQNLWGKKDEEPPGNRFQASQTGALPGHQKKSANPSLLPKLDGAHEPFFQVISIFWPVCKKMLLKKLIADNILSVSQGDLMYSLIPLSRLAAPVPLLRSAQRGSPVRSPTLRLLRRGFDSPWERERIITAQALCALFASRHDPPHSPNPAKVRC